MSGGPFDSAATAKTAKRALKPRDAATLVVVDTEAAEPRVLMGRRRADLVFMPGKYVFPGGRVDPGDRAMVCADCLPEIEERKLLAAMKGTPSVDRARALALAAVRETFEEAGLLIGNPWSGERAQTTSRPPATWRPFLAHGFRPRIGGLSLFARAITPPGRPRRYDTRFFALPAAEIAHRVPPPDGELQSLDWFTLDDARALDLPAITRAVLEDLADRIGIGIGDRTAPVPFYYFLNGSFRRELITEGSQPGP